MSLSIGSSGINYTMLDEVWDNYKYPKQNKFSNTGYDNFNEYDFNERVYTDNPNLQGQTVLSNKAPKPISSPNKGTVFEGFQAQPMDHPSTSKTETHDTYNYQPYDKDNIYSPVKEFNQHQPQNQNYNTRRRSSCDEYIEHVENCKSCYDHLRKRMYAENNWNFNWNMPPKNMMDIILLIIGGAFILFVLDTLRIIRNSR